MLTTSQRSRLLHLWAFILQGMHIQWPLYVDSREIQTYHWPARQVTQKKHIKRQKGRFEALRLEEEEEKQRAREAARQRILQEFDKGQLGINSGARSQGMEKDKKAIENAEKSGQDDCMFSLWVFRIPPFTLTKHVEPKGNSILTWIRLRLLLGKLKKLQCDRLRKNRFIPSLWFQ